MGWGQGWYLELLVAPDDLTVRDEGEEALEQMSPCQHIMLILNTHLI